MAIKENNKDLLILLGKQIKYLRTEQNLSLRKLAQRCDIDFSDINKIEKSERNMQMSTLFEIAKGLQVHPRDLFDFEVEGD